MSLPNRLQNINSNKMNTSDNTVTGNTNDVRDNVYGSHTRLPVSLDTSEEEGQLYIDITKYVATTIAKYKITQFKQFFSKSLDNNSQYNDEGFL